MKIHRDKRGKFRCSETASYKMTNHFGQFNKDAEEAFNEAAAEKYDFGTCQRDDGSYYGTGGTCKKGSPVSGGVPKKEKAGKAAGGGGGSESRALSDAKADLSSAKSDLKRKDLTSAERARATTQLRQAERDVKKASGGGSASPDGGAARRSAKASGEVADRKAAARKENEAKKEANPRTDSKMSSKRAAEVKAAFDKKRQMKAGGQDGPEATTKQRAAAVKNLTRQKNTLLNKQDENGKLSKADSAKLKLIEASMESYR